MAAVTIYPRGGSDTSNFWTGVCPVCSKVHKLYSAGTFICYGAGSPGTEVTTTVDLQDVSTGDGAAQILIAASSIIES